jgi:hypothetical protein
MIALLDQSARDLFTSSMTWLDSYWDAAAGLVRAPGELVYERAAPGATIHQVRETGYYALGLLSRAGPGEAQRAQHALAVLLDNQFDAPGTPFHGTWRRAPEEPDPPPNPTIWRDYDPNWREFIGTALLLALIEHERQLPAAIVERIDAALLRAVAGTLTRQVPASYTNIALMCAFLLDACGARFGKAEWQAQAERYAAEIHALFARHGAFEEYNSPTYYGVDLYALALWRAHAPSSQLRERGQAMEAALWRDIARFYHAGLRNLAGPYDRSYGMDLQRYGGLIGMWIWLAVGRALAAFPDPALPFAHAWDFGSGPAYALLGAQVPGDALEHLRSFQGERLIQQTITDPPLRVASAWVGERVLIGGETGGGEHRNWSQFHPATLHWRLPDGDIGWARLRYAGPADAHAERHALVITCLGEPQDIVFELHAPGVEPGAQQPERWELPGLLVSVEAHALKLTVRQAGDMLELRYSRPVGASAQPAHLRLQVEAR